MIRFRKKRESLDSEGPIPVYFGLNHIMHEACERMSTELRLAQRVGLLKADASGSGRWFGRHWRRVLMKKRVVNVAGVNGKVLDLKSPLIAKAKGKLGGTA